MNEQDYKSLLGVYQKKAMDLFTQLVVEESKIQILESQLSESNQIIQKLTEKIKELSQTESQDFT
jgi:CII-binding regulator of phage lambda lysogenization HflD